MTYRTPSCLLALGFALSTGCVLDPKNVDEPDDSSASGSGSLGTGGETTGGGEDGDVGTDTASSTSASTGNTTGGSTTTSAGSTTDSGGLGDDAAFACEGNEPADAYDFIEWQLDGDSLEITVAYSGGCQDHIFEMCWGPDWAESFPVQVPVLLSHDAMGDDCEAYPQETVVIDLVPLKEAYQQAYQSETGAMELLLIGQDAGITYEF